MTPLVFPLEPRWRWARFRQFWLRGVVRRIQYLVLDWMIDTNRRQRRSQAIGLMMKPPAAVAFDAIPEGKEQSLQARIKEC
jgi:hypothetical protein